MPNPPLDGGMDFEPDPHGPIAELPQPYPGARDCEACGGLGLVEVTDTGEESWVTAGRTRADQLRPCLALPVSSVPAGQPKGYAIMRTPSPRRALLNLATAVLGDPRTHPS